MADSEYLRPKFHFTPDSGWMNDPNGLIYEAETGEYHMFFQYCPTLNEVPEKWWGHAVSKDLFHWTELAPAICPDELGGAWSGCCVSDADNTSGLFGCGCGEDRRSGSGAGSGAGVGNMSRLVALYTAAGTHPVYNYQKQAAAYSVDHGVMWRKYSGNPLIASRPGDQPSFDNRDPSVFRFDFPDGKGGLRQRWVMMVAGMWARLFVSDDLLHWDFCGDVFKKDGSHLESECPDLFRMNVNGDPAKPVWVYSGAGRFFVVGRLEAHADGSVGFSVDSDQIEINMGSDVMYAAQTFNDVPDGRRIFIYWMVDKSALRLAEQGFQKSWDGFQSLPMEAALTERRGQYRLGMRPVSEFFTAVRRKTLESGRVNSPGTVFTRVAPGSFELKLEIPRGQCRSLSLEGLGEFAYRIDIQEDGSVSIDGGRAVQMAFSETEDGENVCGMCRDNSCGPLEMLIVRDGACLDIFSGSGSHAHALVLPKGPGSTRNDEESGGARTELIVLSVQTTGDADADAAECNALSGVFAEGAFVEYQLNELI